MVDLADLRAAAAALPRCRGSARARTAVAAADGAAESPQETRVRLLLVACDLPAPVAQYVVRDADRFRKDPVLLTPRTLGASLWTGPGVGHGEPGPFARDRSGSSG